jgi:predicted LPLAT superfamily acyltransferase
MEEEIICENFGNRIQINRKLRLLSSHYLVFKRNLLKEKKYRIAPQQWSSFLKYFLSENPFCI